MKTNGEESCVGKLYENYGGSLYGFLLKRYGSEEFAKEVLQETFCIACEKEAELSAHPCPGGWLYKTARNKARELGRKRLRIQFYEGAAYSTVLQAGLMMLSEIETKEALKAILTAEDYKMLLLKYNMRFNFREVSQMYGISESACKKRIYRILFRAKQNMTDT